MKSKNSEVMLWQMWRLEMALKVNKKEILNRGISQESVIDVNNYWEKG